MTCSSLAFSVSPSCPRKGCFCCTASTCVLSFLLSILSLSHLNPESAPDGLCPFAQVHIPAGDQGPAQSRPCYPRGPAAHGAERGACSLPLTLPPCIPAGPATCPGSQGKDPELACSRLWQACWGTRDRGRALGAGANLQFPRIPQGRT